MSGRFRQTTSMAMLPSRMPVIFKTGAAWSPKSHPTRQCGVETSAASADAAHRDTRAPRSFPFAKARRKPTPTASGAFCIGPRAAAVFSAHRKSTVRTCGLSVITRPAIRSISRGLDSVSSSLIQPELQVAQTLRSTRSVRRRLRYGPRSTGLSPSFHRYVSIPASSPTKRASHCGNTCSRVGLRFSPQNMQIMTVGCRETAYLEQIRPGRKIDL